MVRHLQDYKQLEAHVQVAPCTHRFPTPRRWSTSTPPYGRAVTGSIRLSISISIPVDRGCRSHPRMQKSALGAEGRGVPLQPHRAARECLHVEVPRIGQPHSRSSPPADSSAGRAAVYNARGRLGSVDTIVEQLCAWRERWASYLAIVAAPWMSWLRFARVAGT